MTISYARYNHISIAAQQHSEIIHQGGCDLCKNTVFLEKKFLPYFRDEDAEDAIMMRFGAHENGKTYLYANESSHIDVDDLMC